jgi:cell division protein FtsZ
MVDYREPAPFIPPAPEMPLRAPRMPTIDDLPLPGQQQLRAQQDPQGFAAVAPDTKRRTLLDRLASFGMSRDPEPARSSAAAQASAQAPVQAPVQAPMMRPPMAAPEFAKRPPAPMRPQAGFDAQPRMAARAPSEDEQLEIPAFLRRQSN